VGHNEASFLILLFPLDPKQLQVVIWRVRRVAVLQISLERALPASPRAAWARLGHHRVAEISTQLSENSSSAETLTSSRRVPVEW
jgi:hypothetical protein